MKKIVLFTTILLAGSSFYGQKNEMINAGIELKSIGYNPMMFAMKIQSGDYADAQKSIITAKQEMDKAIQLQEEKKTLTKSKDLAKYYYYTGVANMSYGMLAQIDENVKKELEANPEAVEKNTTQAFKNSLEASNYYEEEISGLMNQIRAFALNGGVQLFQNKDYEMAFASFASAVEAWDVLGQKDTLAMYNAGLAADNNNDFENAIKYYGMAAELGYGGDAKTYQLMVAAINRKNEGKPSEEAFKVIQKAKEKYPNDLGLTIEEFNYYNSIGDGEKAQAALQKAVEQDPKNPALHFNIGATFDGQSAKEHEKGDHQKAALYVEKAADAYKKAIELNADYFDAYYNLGALYNNESYEINKLKADIKDQKLYEEESTKALNLLKNALPYLEKAHELQPKDKNTLIILKSIYFNIEDEAKYNETAEKLKALE